MVTELLQGEPWWNTENRLTESGGGKKVLFSAGRQPTISAAEGVSSPAGLPQDLPVISVPGWAGILRFWICWAGPHLSWWFRSGEIWWFSLLWMLFTPSVLPTVIFLHGIMQRCSVWQLVIVRFFLFRSDSLWGLLIKFLFLIPSLLGLFFVFAF